MPWNKGFETDMSACVGWDLDKRLCINTLGVGPVIVLTTASAVVHCNCCETHRVSNAAIAHPP